MALFPQADGLVDARPGELVCHGIGQRTRTLPAACKRLQAAKREGMWVRETRIGIRSCRRIQQSHCKNDPQDLRIPRFGLSRTQTPPPFRHALTTKIRIEELVWADVGEVAVGFRQAQPCLDKDDADAARRSLLYLIFPQGLPGPLEFLVCQLGQARTHTRRGTPRRLGVERRCNPGFPNFTFPFSGRSFPPRGGCRRPCGGFPHVPFPDPSRRRCRLRSDR